MEVKLYQGLLEINWNLLFSAITVLVLYLILKHFFFEKVHNFMEARKAAVQASLDQAEAANEEAQTLLLTTNMTITDIAMQCGYNNSNYFQSVFSNIVGMPPGKYRKTWVQ